MIKTCRLIALGPSATEAPHYEEGKDTFGIQYTWRHWKLDRAFVMDDQEWIVAKNNFCEDSKDISEELKEIGIPIYVAKKWPNVPNTVEYPIDKVSKEFGVKYFMNSMAYMFAIAILEGYERIETYGIDLRYFNELGDLIWRPQAEKDWGEFMKENPEWTYPEFLKYQHCWLDETHCGAFWAGVAIGRGIEVSTTDRSSLMKPVCPEDTNMYGYEVSSAIKEQRKHILLERKENKKSGDQRVGIVRRPKGMSDQDFMKKIQSGELKPESHSNAKITE